MGKVLLYELGQSISFGRLTLLAKVLWPMLLAASDNQGRGLAEPDVIKWHVCPNVPELTVGNISELLEEMVNQDMLCLYQDSRERTLYQVMRWWDYQRLQWAQPSKFEPPAGWIDRVRAMRRDNGMIKSNWDTPGGFEEDDDLEDAEAANVIVNAGNPPVNPPGNPDARLIGNPPGSPPGRPIEVETNLTKPNLIQPNPTESETTSAPSVAKRRKSAPKPAKKRVLIPAIEVFRLNSGRYPSKVMYDDIVTAVGSEQPSLELWGKIVKAYVGNGWNPGNVRNMLEFFARREIPPANKTPIANQATGPPSGPVHKFKLVRAEE